MKCLLEDLGISVGSWLCTGLTPAGFGGMTFRGIILTKVLTLKCNLYNDTFI